MVVLPPHRVHRVPRHKPRPDSTSTIASRLVLRLGVLAIFALTSAAPPSAKADVLFEGYSKVMLGDTHIGYVVQRYEFDPKKQEFLNAYYLKTNQAGGNITESLKARSTASLKPISYQFTELSGDRARTIDASFKGEQMTAIVKEGAKQQTISKKVPKGTFLSSFLVYLMLQGKEGIKAGAKYGYQAIAEEDGNIYTGEAFISAQESVSGINAFKVLNTFKGSRFVSYVTHKGEILSTRSPVQQIATELVPTMQEATAGLSFTPANLTLLFGSVPKGQENSVARKAPSATGGPAASPSAQNPTAPGATSTGAAEGAGSDKAKLLNATPAPTESSAKKEGVPGGAGIQIKPAPEAQAAPEGKTGP